MPIFGAGGKQGAQPEFGGFGFIDVEDGQVAFAAGGDVEAEAEAAPHPGPLLAARRGRSGAGTVLVEEGGEALAEELLDCVFARCLAGGAEVAELLEDLVGFEVNALD